MSAGTIRVLATERYRGAKGVQLADRRSNLIRGKRITPDGLFDELTKVTAAGPVEVPNCRYYQGLIAQGVLVEAQVAKAQAPAKATGRKE
jgi:hypothetical protein